MNNWLLLALISLIVYIPSFNASGSYSSSSSSSSSGGRRRRRIGGGKGGRTGSGYDGSDVKSRPTRPTGRDIDDAGKRSNVRGISGSVGSDVKLDKDYRDIIEYISKEINKDKGSDYTKDKGSYSTRRRDDDISGPRDDGSYPSYPRGRNDDYRNDDYRNDDYRNDDYRNGADDRYPPYVPPSYIPYPAPGYSSNGGGNKGALSSGLLLQLTETIHEQAGSIAEIQQSADQCKMDLAQLKATQYKLLDYILILTTALKKLIGDLSIDITPPSLGVKFYICKSGANQCEQGSIVAMAGELTEEQEDYLAPADGTMITDNDMGHPIASVCDQLSDIFGDADDADGTTCIAPNLTGKYLVGAGCPPNKDGIHADLGQCVGSNILDFTGEGYEFPTFPDSPPTKPNIAL